jgi:hypothetical protein
MASSQSDGSVAVGSLLMIALPAVAHIGTLNPADKGRDFAFSHEGHGLSVSVDPEEWERIARLGGRQWHLLRKDSGRFLDYWALTRRQRLAITSWGIVRRYVVRKVVWAARLWDDELEETIVTYHETKQLAREEQDGAGEVRRAGTLEATQLLSRRLGMTVGFDAFDHLLVCYVEDQHPQLDGVWWEDAHGPLSAPRGVIRPARIPDWTVTPLGRRDADRALHGDDA